MKSLNEKDLQVNICPKDTPNHYLQGYYAYYYDIYNIFVDSIFCLADIKIKENVTGRLIIKTVVKETNGAIREFMYSPINLKQIINSNIYKNE
jgi:hypothetical protein